MTSHIFSRKRFRQTIALAITSFGLAMAAHGETLEQIYQQALLNDHEFKAAQAAFAAGQENLAIGRAGLLPQIGGTYVYSRRELTEDRTDGAGEEETTTTSKVLSAELRQPLFDLSAWYNYQRGDSLSSLAEAQFGAEKQDLIIRTAEAYFDALKAVDNLETAIAEESALSHQLEQTKQRFDVGLTAITEVHEAQAAYDTAVALRLTTEGNLGIAFEALEVLTGEPHDQLAPIRDNFPVDRPVPADRHEWVEMAVQNNYSLSAASFNAQAARQTSRAQTSEHLPTVYGQLGYSDTSTDSELAGLPAGPDVGLNSFIREGEETSVSVTVSLPLFTGGGTSARRRQAQQESLQAQEEFYQAQRDVVQSTRSLHLSVVTSVASVKARQQAITSSRSALEATQAGYDVGTRDLVDVLNAQRNLYSAQRDYYDALYTYVLNSLRLKAAAGTLSAEDIAALNQWLDPQNPVSKNKLDTLSWAG